MRLPKIYRLLLLSTLMLGAVAIATHQADDATVRASTTLPDGAPMSPAFCTDAGQPHTNAVTVTGPIGTDGSFHGMELTIQVTEPYSFYAYLPLVARMGPRYPNDSYYTDQWALEKIEAPGAWGLSTGPGMLIAVVDSGTDLDHPDLASKVRTDIDHDFVNDDDTADDDYGHGTHVSGIAAAATDNGVGVAGLGWEATILPLKILNASGIGYDDDLATAIRYAADEGAHVINMSLGAAGSCPEIVQQAVDYAYAKGAVLVAAAGNNLGNQEVFPASCEHVLGVAATQSNDSVAGYSTYGDHVSVAAPGSEIYSTGWVSDSRSFCTSGYCTKWGTSMAAPHVAGLAALLLARYPSYTPDQVASAMLDNADEMGASGWDQHSGCGRINAFTALSVGAHSSSPLCLQGVGPWSADVSDVDAERTADAASFAPGEIIVAFQPGVKAETTFPQYEAEFLPAIQAWRLQVPPGQEQAILSQLRADPTVAYTELNYQVSAQ